MRRIDEETLMGFETYLHMQEGTPLTNLLNAFSFLKSKLGKGAWVGVYLYDETKKALVLGPFIGTPACLKILPSRGVCGACYSEKKEIYVSDVHQFPGHIACDASSLSEYVNYLCVNGKEIVFDVDSDELDGLKDDVPGLRQITKRLEKAAYFAA